VGQCAQGPRVRCGPGGLGISSDDVNRQTDPAGRRVRPESQARYVVEGRVVSKGDGRQAVKVTWTREADLMHTDFNTVVGRALEAGLDAQGQAGGRMHRSVARPILSTFRGGRKERGGAREGMGVINVPLAIPSPHREPWRRGGAHPHRLVPPTVSNTRTRSRSVPSPSSPRWPRRRGRDQNDYLMAVIGPARRVLSRRPGAIRGNTARPRRRFTRWTPGPG